MYNLRPARNDDADGIARLLGRCEAVDGFPPLSEFKALRVPVATSLQTVVLGESNELKAIGVAAWHAAKAGDGAGYWAAELAVDPAERSTAAYLRVLGALQAATGAPVSLWTFSDRQRAAAVSGGLVEVRSLVVMELALPAGQVELPPGLSVRAFRPGEDVPAWLQLNRRVFGDHPEAGSIDQADLELRMAQSWFDAAGFLILTEAGRPVGYCWTKRHSAAVGEIYMIGLVPEVRGRHLARPLTLAGLDYLNRTGADRVILYAEKTNEAAIGLYRSMGFEVIREIGLFSAPVDELVDD